MGEKFTPQPDNLNSKEAWLAELRSEKTRERILGYIRGMKFSEEDADDLVQETMIKADEAIRLGQFRGYSKLTTWLHSIIKNEGLNLLKKQKRSTAKNISFPENLELTDTEPNSEEKYITAEEARSLKSHFPQLARGQRKIVELFVEGLNYKEIAEHLKIEIGTVKSQLFRATEHLRQFVKK